MKFLLSALLITATTVFAVPHAVFPNRQAQNDHALEARKEPLSSGWRIILDTEPTPLAAPHIILPNPPHDHQILPRKEALSSGWRIILDAEPTSTISGTLPSATVPVTAVSSVVTPIPTAPASTVPAPPAPAPTEKPVSELGAVYVCEHYGWGGKCELIYHELGSGPENCVELDGTASSVGPDPDFTCTFFKSSNCRSLEENDSIVIEWPGNDNLLNTPKGSFNDIIHSYFCLAKA